MFHRSNPFIPLLLAASLALLAGCGGASKERGGDDDPPGARVVDEADLDTGSYPTTPAKIDKTVGDDLANGRAVEAQRIANVVVDPKLVDPRFEVGTSLNGRMASPNDVTRLFASEDPKLVATRVSGGVASRRFARDPDADPGLEPTDINIVVLSFDTPAAAQAFTTGIGNANVASGRDPIFNQPFRGVRTTIPGHPTARASLYYVGDGDRDPNLSVLQTDGRMVVYLFAGGPGRLVTARRAMLGKALTMQLEALEDFEPKRLAELMGAEIDPTGVARRALALPAGRTAKQEPNIVKVWDRNGALHQQSWAGDLPEAFERADLDVMASGSSSVYRTGSAQQASKLLDDFEAAATANQYRTFNAPKGLREARCYELIDMESSILAPYYCQVQHGRYIGEFGAKTADQAEDGISAQYLILQDA